MYPKLWLLLAVAAACFVVGDAQAYDATTAPVREKLGELERLLAAKNVPVDLGAYKNPVTRPTTLRDSGREESLLFIAETNFRFVGDIGFYVPRLIASLRSNDATQPVVFDDPTSFTIRPLTGSVILSGAQLDALLNDHVFKFPGATVRKLKVSTGPGMLTLAGEMDRKKKWVPFVMTGGLELVDGHILEFTPSEVYVDGVAVHRALIAANATLDELLQVKAHGAELIGSTIYLNTRLLFPPPRLDLRIKAARLEANGLMLDFDAGPVAPSFATPLQAGQSHILVKTGDVKLMRAMPIDASIQIVSAQADRGLDFCLYCYRDQVAGGYLKMMPDGGVVAHLLNYAGLPRAGSASAGGFIANQQARMRVSKAKWETIAVPAGMQTGAVRPWTTRDSGASSVSFEARDVNFAVTKDIGFYIHHLAASLEPVKAGEPVDFDDPRQFVIRVHHGDVTLTPAALTALFNEHILDFPSPPLNQLKLSAADGVLIAAGDVKLWRGFPGLWLPLSLSGGIALNAQNRLVYAPSAIEVLGIPLAGLLQVIGLDLDLLLNLKREGVELVDSHIEIDHRRVFPPPALAGVIATAKMTAAGLRLGFADNQAAQFLPIPTAAKSYLWMQSGDAKLYDIIVTNANVLVLPDQADQVLHFDLYDYRQLVAKGTLLMQEDGAITVKLPPRAPTAQ